MTHMFLTLFSVWFLQSAGINQQTQAAPTVKIDTSLMSQVVVPTYLKKQNPMKKKYTMVTYVDKADCPICFINHLQEWEIFMNECKKENVNLNFIFIFKPTDSELTKFKTMLSSSSIATLSFIDSSDVFPKMNPWINQDNSMHSFIVDNHIILKYVENPPYDKIFMNWIRNL